MDRVTEKVAIVTGAARGIGAATAKLLARRGWRVMAVDHTSPDLDPVAGPHPATPEELERIVTTCREFAPALGFEADVRLRGELDEAVELATRALGPIFAAVAAAGRIGGADAWDTPSGLWQEMIEINLYGVRNLAEATIPIILDSGGEGRFVAVSSAAAIRGLERLGAYAASKAATVGFVKSMAADLGGTGVTANVVCPGSTDTEMLSASTSIYGLDERSEFAAHQLVGRLLEPGELAEAIAFLCEPAASAITGAVIPVDGGMTT